MTNTTRSRAAFARLCVVAGLLLGGNAYANSLALGDSIALGTGRALGVETVARVGEPSCPNRLRAGIVSRIPAGHFDRAVISAGVNDAPGRCIEAIRAKLDAGRVVWILPPPVNSARAHIERVAAQYGDRTVSYVPGRDGLHPRSYPEVARAVEAAW